MPEKKISARYVRQIITNFLWLASLAMGAQITDID